MRRHSKQKIKPIHNATLETNQPLMSFLLVEAAEAGDTKAMLTVAESFRKGINSFEENLDEAIKWYEQLYRDKTLENETRAKVAWGLLLCKHRVNSIAPKQGQIKTESEKAEMEELYTLLVRPEYALKEAWVQQNRKLLKLRLAEIYLDREPSVSDELTKAVKFLEEVGTDGLHEAWFVMIQAYKNRRLKTHSNEESLEKIQEYLGKIENLKDPEVMRRLAIMYHYPEEQGRAQDILKAKDWYEKAADCGDVKSMAALAEIYRTGRGKAIPKDLKKSKRWFEKVLKCQNISEEMAALTYFGLGYLSEQKIGKEEPNPTQALAYYQQAAVRGHLIAVFRGAVLIEQKAHKNKQKRSENLQESFEYYEYVAMSDSQTQDEQTTIREAQFRLASFYEEGKGDVAQNLEKALEWYQKALDKGHPKARLKQIAVLLKLAETQTPKSIAEYEKIASIDPQNQVPEILEYIKIAQFRLGELYQSQNLEKAIEWYKKAQQNGYTHENVQDKIIVAEYQLAKACALSSEQRLLEKAFKLYETVTKQESDAAHVQACILDAKHQLIQCYQEGSGVQQDLGKAIKLCQEILQADPSDAGIRAILGELNEHQQEQSKANAPFLPAHSRKTKSKANPTAPAPVQRSIGAKKSVY